MHLTLMLVLATAAPSLGPSLDLSGGGRVSQASGVLDWSRSWADLSLAMPSGIPAPTISCVAAAADGELACTGATATKVGSPTTVTAAGYPERGAVRLGGSADFYTLGTGGNPGAADFGLCATFKPTGNGFVVGKYDTDSGAFSWGLRVSSGNLVFYARYASGLIANRTLSAALPLHTVHTACVAFDWVDDGNSVLRASVDGVAVADLGSLHGPIVNSANLLKIGASGADAAPGEFFPGDILDVRLWLGASAFAAADLVTVISSQQARLAAKPVNAAVTVTSGATLCESTPGTLYSLPANSLCVSSAGASIYGAAQHSSLLTYGNTFENAAWTKDTGTSVADASASCPLGPLGTRMALFTADGDGEGVSQDAATGTARIIWLAYPTGGSACSVTLSDASGDGAATVALTASPVRATGAAAGQTGIKVAKPSGGCATWCQQMATVQASLVAGMDTPTLATPVVGSADIPSTASTLVTGKPWFVGAKFTMTAAGPIDGRIFSLGTAGANSAYVNSGYFGIFDSSNTQKYAALSPVVLASGARTVIAGATAGGEMSLWVDGVQRALTIQGAGTGILTTQPSTIYIGSNGAATQLNGSISKLCQGRDYKSVARCLAQ